MGSKHQVIWQLCYHEGSDCAFWEVKSKAMRMCQADPWVTMVSQTDKNYEVVKAMAGPEPVLIVEET